MMLRPASASLALHVVLLGGLALWMVGRPGDPGDDEQGVKVELVLLQTAGAGPPSSPTRAMRPAAAGAATLRLEPAPSRTPPALTPTQATPANAAGAPAAASRPAAAPAVPAAPLGPRINHGGTDSPSNATASGDDVIPAKADARYPNLPPVYPAEAIEQGQQGTVMLLVRVSPVGLPTAVEVSTSSGFPLLDRAASEAVQTWHFWPALRDGTPVAGELPLRVRFEFGADP